MANRTATAPAGCGASRVMGLGENAICGRPYYGDPVYLCDRCLLNRALAQVKELEALAAGRLPTVLFEGERVWKGCSSYVPPDMVSKVLDSVVRLWREDLRAAGQGRELPPVQGWVSVKERLPDLDVPVWLHDGKGGIWLGGRCDVGDGQWGWGNCYSSIYQDKDRRWVAGDLEFDDDYTVVEWMPLPTAEAREEASHG